MAKNRLVSQEEKKNYLPQLLILFVVSFLIRAVLSCTNHESVNVYIDEVLYPDLAKSLLYEGKLLFRNQPTDYPFLFYPILLMPMYWLHDLLGGDIYRWTQVYNSLLITISIFPAFYFALDYTGKPSRAAYATAIVLLMPDQIMACFSMAESVMIPLSMWLLMFGWRMYSRKEARWGVLTGVVTGLMFFSKPGSVVMGAVLLLFYLIRAIRRKERVKAALGFAAVAVAMVIGVYVLFFLLQPGMVTLMGLYNKQFSTWTPRDILVSIVAAFGEILLFTALCCGAFLFLPLAFRKKLDDQQRAFMYAVVLGMVAILGGTAVFVVPYKWYGGLRTLPLHLRYSSMYLPAFVVFTLALDFRRQKSSFMTVAMIAFVLLQIFPGVRMGFVPNHGATIDSLALAPYITMSGHLGTTDGLIVTIVMVITSFLLFISTVELGWSTDVQLKWCKIFLVCFLLFNTICGYGRVNVKMDETLKYDVMELDELVKESDEPCIAILQTYSDLYGARLDSRLTRPIQMLTTNQLYNAFSTTGIYEPFIPTVISPYRDPVLTPQTSTLILTKDVVNYTEFTDSVRLVPTQNGNYTVVYLTEGEPWVDTMLVGMGVNNVLSVDTGGGYLWFRNPNRDNNGIFTLNIVAKGPGRLALGDKVSFELTEETETYTITGPFETRVTLRPLDQDVYIYSYSTEIYE